MPIKHRTACVGTQHYYPIGLSRFADKRRGADSRHYYPLKGKRRARAGTPENVCAIESEGFSFPTTVFVMPLVAAHRFLPQTAYTKLYQLAVACFHHNVLQRALLGLSERSRNACYHR